MTSADQPSFWSVPEDEQAVLRADLGRLTAQILELDGEIKSLDGPLQPILAREEFLRQRIAETYDYLSGGRLQFSFSGVEDRKPLLEELTVIAGQWGETRAKHACLRSLRRQYRNEATSIAKILKSEKRRKQRKPHAKSKE